MEPISTFSGAHPFRPAHLLDAIARDLLGYDDPRAEAVEPTARLVALIDAGKCPRCEGGYRPGEIPSGSRATRCRCIPVCMDCSTLESLPTLYSVLEWPLSADDLDDERAERDAKRAKARLEAIPISGLAMGPSSGGWLEYGYEDSPDDEERRGR